MAPAAAAAKQAVAATATIVGRLDGRLTDRPRIATAASATAQATSEIRVYVKIAANSAQAAHAQATARQRLDAMPRTAVRTKMGVIRLASPTEPDSEPIERKVLP